MRQGEVEGCVRVLWGHPPPSISTGGSAQLLPQLPLSLPLPLLPRKPPEGRAEPSSCPQRTCLNSTLVGEVKHSRPPPGPSLSTPKAAPCREAREALTDVLWDPLAGSAVETRSIIMFYCGF